MDGSSRIEHEVGAWEGVSVQPHRFGEIEFRLGSREIGHLHARSRVDVPFPRRIRDMLLETGRAGAHELLPDSGWVSRPIDGTEDVDEAIELLRLSYERARVARAVHTTR